jgi:hypothetical protein
MNFSSLDKMMMGMGSIEQYIQNLQKEMMYCSEEARRLYKYLCSELHDFADKGMIELAPHPMNHCIRPWKIPGKSLFGGISVSVPSDRCGNRMVDGVGPTQRPSTFEIALLGSSLENLVYYGRDEYEDHPEYKELNYEDVRSFSSYEEVLEEIKRLIAWKDTIVASTATNSSSSAKVADIST